MIQASESVGPGTIIAIVGSCTVVTLLALLITIHLKKKKRGISGKTNIYNFFSGETASPSTDFMGIKDFGRRGYLVG